MARKTIKAGGNKLVSLKDKDAKGRPYYLAYQKAQLEPIKTKGAPTGVAKAAASAASVGKNTIKNSTAKKVTRTKRKKTSK